MYIGSSSVGRASRALIFAEKEANIKLKIKRSNNVFLIIFIEQIFRIIDIEFHYCFDCYNKSCEGHYNNLIYLTNQSDLSKEIYIQQSQIFFSKNSTPAGSEKLTLWFVFLCSLVSL